MSERLCIYFLGRLEYPRALEIQELVHRRTVAGGPDTLLLLEHWPVYTLGRGGRREHIEGALASGLPVFRVARGGGATYHGPGQLVGYPIVRLAGRRGDVHGYVRALEAALVAAAAQLGVSAQVRPGLVGVWARGRKLASIGIGVRRRVALHGFALNVGPELAPFGAIVPCGLQGVEMTSVSLELGRPAALEEAVGPVGAWVAQELGYGAAAAWCGGEAELAAELGGLVGAAEPCGPTPSGQAGATAS